MMTFFRSFMVIQEEKSKTMRMLRTNVNPYLLGRGYSRAAWKKTVGVVSRVSSRMSCIANALSTSTAGSISKSEFRSMKCPWKVLNFIPAKINEKSPFSRALKQYGSKSTKIVSEISNIRVVGLLKSCEQLEEICTVQSCAIFRKMKHIGIRGSRDC